MKILKAKQYVKNLFFKHNIDKDEVDKLFMEVLNLDYSKLILHEEISILEYIKIKFYAKQRIKGKPLTKIFHRAYFYGLELYVNKHVLSPRQETEILVENTLKYIHDNSNVLDLCTGSGAIAVALKLNSNATITACDISSKALKVAKKNAKKHHANIKFIKSDMFSNITEKFDVIVSNPPYIESDEIKFLDKAVKNYDPLISLDGGINGLKFYEIIAQNADKFLTQDGVILLEIGYNQAESVKKLLNKYSFDSICLKDYENKDRIIIGKRK